MSALSYFDGDAKAKALGLFRILDEDGSADAEAAAPFDADLCMKLYRGMLLIRTMDTRLMAIQRQGRIGFYAEILGQEAAATGTAAVLEPQDWIVPALREAGVGLLHGMPLDRYISQLFGNAADVTKGRQMPCHPSDRDTHYVNMSSCVANQLPQAVGIAWAMKLMGHTGKIAVGYMGDGGTSTGDFHAALNFAGVSRAPVVYICQNNQWAISTPGTVQTASETIAIKGLGYGVESLRADGNDALAVYTVTKYAADKARRGDGPTFIELLTYRVSAHSSSDDPSRYRDESITDVWRSTRDPLVRLRRYMTGRGWLDDARHEEMRADFESQVRALIAKHEAIEPPAIDTMFEDVYEQPTWLQNEQLEYVRHNRAAQRGHGSGHGS